LPAGTSIGPDAYGSEVPSEGVDLMSGIRDPLGRKSPVVRIGSDDHALKPMPPSWSDAASRSSCAGAVPLVDACLLEGVQATRAPMAAFKGD
jgi:hypothetical protein